MSNIVNDIVLIGAAGHQGSEYFKLFSQKHKIVALVDENLELLQQKYEGLGIPLVKNLDSMSSAITYDGAIVCVPHYLHKEITLRLIEQKKTIIKEKPLAITSNDIDDYLYTMKKYRNSRLFTIVQRNFNPIFIEAKQKLSHIGKVYHYQYTYSLCVPNQTTGWRADWNKTYGGVLLDMGYHALDIILSFFSKPLFSSAVASYCYKSMPDNQLEDSISILMQHENGISGSLVLNRHSSEKTEIFTILGSEGSIKITPQAYNEYDRYGNEVKNIKYSIDSNKIKLAMFEFYLNLVNDMGFLKNHFDHHCKIVREIEHIYQYINKNQYTLAA